MLKLKIFIFVAVIATVSCMCPHALNKRQAPGGGNTGGQPGGGNTGGQPVGGNTGGQTGGGNTGAQPGGGNTGGQPGGPGGNTGGNFPPGFDNDNNQPPPEDLNGPQENGGKGDKRPRPTVEVDPVGNCDATTRYATADGACNNLQKPDAGREQDSFQRYLDAAYEGDNLPRSTSVNGGDLPNPRFISRYMMNDNSLFESEVSDILPYFGQWLAHDFSEIQDGQDENGFIDCPCGSTNTECLSFSRPALDEKVTQDCFSFIRSVHTNDGDNVRQQTNFMSSYIDGTQTYGKNQAITDTLRLNVDGKLKNSGNDLNYLPTDTALFCETACFVAGEDRPSENMALTSIQTLWLRNHNKVAEGLKAEHGDWNDEKLFQETRKINIATIQNVVYGEFLPVVIGNLANDIDPQENGYYNGYDASVDSRLEQGFSVAAFRFGHSLIREELERYDYNYESLNSPVNLGEIIFDTTEAYNDNGGIGGLEKILMGLLSQPSSKYDSNIIDHFQNHLFEFADEEGNVIAFDLPAVNINRGRDHGLSAYAKYLEYCSDTTVDNWSDLSSVMTSENIAILSANGTNAVYSSPRDVDLFVGGLKETPVEGALVGPTFACIIKKQFSDLKNGDRFYFENGPEESETAFSLGQLSTIRKTTLSGLICDNFSGVSTIQKNAFKMTGSSNQRVSCDTISKLDTSRF